MQIDQTFVEICAKRSEWEALVKFYIHTDTSTLFMTHASVKTTFSFSVFLRSTEAAY